MVSSLTHSPKVAGSNFVPNTPKGIIPLGCGARVILLRFRNCGIGIFYYYCSRVETGEMVQVEIICETRCEKQGVGESSHEAAQRNLNQDSLCLLSRHILTVKHPP